ncbi:hypothetical protein [Cohnella kolymensis]|uniref:hypothetical protein n=1 Tax=Cohnella kolymensis TaxID=1590652 RepID=UPI000AB4C8B4|nr:hypothetical protein [Cohnella kolymensis]
MRSVNRRLLHVSKLALVMVLAAGMVFTSAFLRQGQAHAATDFTSMTDDELLDYESHKSFDFFWKEANTDCKCGLRFGPRPGAGHGT